MRTTYFSCLCFVPLALAQTAASLPSSGDSSSPEYVGFSYGGTTRSTMVLVWSCLVTIFACSWTVVHHKIPEPSDSALKIFLRKLGWMLITIIAPELTVGIAFNQWESCRVHRDAMQKMGNNEWTLSHSFYAEMGGYVIPVAMPENETVNKYRALTMPEVTNILRKPDVRARRHFPKLSEKDIKAFGKADGFAKLFTCVQSGWLVVQSIARRIQHLPISELEIATLALVTVSFMIYLLWWGKPYDANQQTVIRPHDDAYLEEFQAQILDSDAGTKLDMWALHTHLIDRGYTGFGAVMFSVPFGAVHCIAWNFYFLTSTERYLWRTCSIIVMVSMFVGWLFLLFLQPTDRLDISWRAENVRSWIYVFLEGMLALVYVGARIILIFQAFYCLRSQPAGVYTSATWINFIPHVG